jgi:hypothetical protein
VRKVLGPIFVIIAVVFGFLIWQNVSSQRRMDEVIPPPPAVTLVEKHLAFGIGQLEKICLSGVAQATKSNVAANVYRTATISASGMITNSEEVIRGAGSVLPPEARAGENNEIRRCIADNFEKVFKEMAARPDIATEGPCSSIITGSNIGNYSQKCWGDK